MNTEERRARGGRRGHGRPRPGRKPSHPQSRSGSWVLAWLAQSGSGQRGHFLEGDWVLPWGDLGPFWSCRVLGALVLGPRPRVNPGSRPGQPRDRSDGLAFKFAKQPLVEAGPLLLQLSAQVGAEGWAGDAGQGAPGPPGLLPTHCGEVGGLCGWAEFRRKSRLHWRRGAFWWGGLYTGLTEVL